MSIKVLSPGLYTTVQDIGRTGFQKYGVVVSGAMDTISYRLANLLVGNFSNEAALEITLLGPTLLFNKNAVISICGADMTPKINGKATPIGKAIEVKKGDIVSFGTPLSGCRSYLAISGGIQVEPVLGSKSTFVQGPFGGYRGRKLRKDDELLILETWLNKKINWRLSPFSYSFIHEELSPIRVIKGKQYDWFSASAQKAFFKTKYKIQSESNRMGFRLDGEPLYLHFQKELITEAVTFGSIQVPPNGLPIILMADRQTTGGYPKIAQVAAIDLPRLAQRKPGNSISFTEISFNEAQQLYIEIENDFNSLQKIIEYRMKGVIHSEMD